jgi:hypothetical protein
MRKQERIIQKTTPLWQDTHTFIKNCATDRRYNALFFCELTLILQIIFLKLHAHIHG